MSFTSASLQSESSWESETSTPSQASTDSQSQSSQPAFQIGDRVIVHGLLKASHLNGRHGCIGGEMDVATGRYPIDVDTWPNRVMARDANLKHEPEGDETDLHVADVVDGVLVRSESRRLGLILDVIRFLVGSVLLEKPEIQRGLIDIEQLRQQGKQAEIHALMDTAWKHWEDAKPYYTPDNLNVYQLTLQFFQEWPQANAGHKMPTEFFTATAALNRRTAVQGWNTRIEGQFWIVGFNEDNGGTFLVADANRHLVFEVFGMRNSLLDGVEEEEPVLIKATLLPWYGRLVCDQAVRVSSEVADLELEDFLYHSVDLAQEEGRVVKKLRGLDLPLTEEESHFSAVTLTESHYLKLMADMPIAHQDEAIWCMRRRGYTEHDNPHHVGVIINGVGGVAVGPFSCSALEPSSVDILQALVAYSSAGENGKALPAELLIDEKKCFERMQFLLKHFDIGVQYYPPPTPEETESALG